jgi:hypothetical protein
MEADKVLKDHRDTAAQRAASTPLMSMPSHVTVPVAGRYSPAKSFASVVLPEPFSPTNATISPARMLSETSRSAGSVAQMHALHSIVKRRRLQAEEVDRCCDLQDILIDVSLHQFAEDRLSFALHCVDERMDSGNASDRNRPGCDGSERLTALECIEECLQALLSEQ